jgi:hypothetical protein
MGRENAAPRDPGSFFCAGLDLSVPGGESTNEALPQTGEKYPEEQETRKPRTNLFFLASWLPAQTCF